MYEQDDEEVVIVNDQSENGQKQAEQSNKSTSNKNCFMAHLSLWLALIALGVAFLASFISLCGGFSVGAWFGWIARGVAIASLVLECLKFLKTKQFNLKGDLFFVVIIVAILCIGL